MHTVHFWSEVEQSSELGAAYPWLVAGFFALALLVMYLAPATRVRCRTALLLFLLSILGCVGAALILRSGFSPNGSLYLMVRFSTLLVEAIALVTLTSVLVFDGLLRAARLRPPTIAQDLIIALTYVTIAIALLAQSGVDLRGIVATSAVLTAVIGFSLQDALGNVMGGIALQMERTIRAGDWIRIEEIEGWVKEIRWRQTSLETRNGDTVVIPNSAMVKAKVTLLGRRARGPQQRRQWVAFNVDVSHSPTKVIAAVETALHAEPMANVAAEPTLHCLVTEVKNGVASYAVRYWLTDLAQADVTDSLIRTRVYAALRRANIPLSSPAQSVILTEERSHRERLESKESMRRAAALQSLRFFQLLTADERNELAAGLINAPFVQGEAMTRQGAQANWLYMIVEGEAEVRVTVDGFARKVAALRAGDYFGEMGLMTGEPRSATVLALSDVKCYRLGKEAFEAILHRRPELAEKISQTLAQRRVGLENVKEEIGREAFRDQMLTTQSVLLRRIRDFFGLNAERAA